MSQQGPHFSPHSTAKHNDKNTFLRTMVSSGISDVVFTSVHEKTRLKKCMMYKSQETTVFSSHPDYRHETEARKVMIPQI